MKSTPEVPAAVQPAAGRPRDQRIDSAVRRAALELLDDVGYPRLTIPMVATRAGTTPPAVYRRWPTKVELVHETVVLVNGPQLVPNGPDFGTDLRTMVDRTVTLFSRRAVRSALAGLIAEVAARPELADSLLGELQRSVAGALQERLDRAVSCGQVSGGLDGHTLLNMIGGTVLHAISNGRVLDDQWVAQFTAFLMKGLA